MVSLGWPLSAATTLTALGFTSVAGGPLSSPVDASNSPNKTVKRARQDRHASSLFHTVGGRWRVPCRKNLRDCCMGSPLQRGPVGDATATEFERDSFRTRLRESRASDVISSAKRMGVPDD